MGLNRNLGQLTEVIKENDGNININTELLVNGNTTLSGSLNVTGSLIGYSGITGSLEGTASFALSASYAPGTTIDNNVNNYLLTATGGETINGESQLTFNPANEILSVQGTIQVRDDLTVGRTSIFSGTLLADGGITGSLEGTASNATSASFATTAISASYAPGTTIDNNVNNYLLTATGGESINGESTLTYSASILNVPNIEANTISASSAIFTSASIGFLQSVSGSVKLIGDAYIVLNNDTPTERYAGISIFDSGSVGITASFNFDGQTNDWFYSYQDEDGISDYGVTLFGPEYTTKGTPIYLTNNRIPKSNGGHHLNDSNISDNGSVVSINSNTQVTGSLTVTNSITGSLFGTATNATSASFATNAVSSSFSTNILGTNNTIPKFTGTNTLGNSNITDDGLNVTISTAATINTIYVGLGASGSVSNIMVGRTTNINNSGTQNSFFGNQAGQLNLNGSNNSFFGFLAGANSNGSTNSFFGSQAGQSSLDGGNNSFFGFAAGSNSKGNSNSYFGFAAGTNLSIGSNNSFFGDAAGTNLLNGSSNVFLGDSAGRLLSNGANNTILNDSILIGRDTRPLGNSQTNQIVIGHNAIGFGSNTTVLGNSSIGTTVIYGRLLLGQTVDNSTDRLQITGNVSVTGSIRNSGSLAVGSINPSAVIGRIDASNDVVAFSTSDKHLKENIQPIPNALDKLDKIGGYTFDWKTEEDLLSLHGYEGSDIGVIAQEIEEILPEIVITRDNGYKAVKYEKIVPFLIQCIKELKDEIDNLKSQK
jgi:hypothetical protein